MRGRHRFGNLQKQAGGLGEVYLLPLFNDAGEILPIEQFHGQEHVAAFGVVVEFVNAADTRVSHGARRENFGAESLAVLHVAGQVGRDCFQRDSGARGEQVRGFEDLAHSARSQHTDNAESSGQ